MKKFSLMLLALVLLFSGCSSGRQDRISVGDVCCPYEIRQVKETVKVSFEEEEEQSLLWQVAAVPEDICVVSNEKEDQYRIVGRQEGAAQVTFTAVREDETVQFVLTLVIHVDSQMKASLSTYGHRERSDISVEADGLKYTWNVDVEGVLSFSLINSEDNWSVHGDGEGVCTLLQKMSTPSGYKFTAQAAGSGQTEILLVGEETQRTIRVTVRSEDSGALEVISVQEQ